MELPVTAVTNEQSGIGKEFAFGVKTKNLHVIFNFLRNQCYSDAVRAILREYGTNAQDVHLRHGITNPIRVSLPTMLDSFLKVRDFGPALSDDKIGEIYTSYGESDKRDSNVETGALGLGCKSGFAYGDSFMVNCYRSGLLTVWNAYIDPSQEGRMACMCSDVPTDQPDGLEVVIPIKGEDIKAVRATAMDVYSYFDVTPDIVNITTEEKDALDAIKTKKPIYSGAGWKYIGSGKSLAVMANVAYPLDATPFTDMELPEDLRQFLSGGVIINFDNGALEFAISREALQYTPLTKKSVLAKIRSISDEVVAETKQRFDGAKTLWDSKLLWKQVFNFDGGLYYLRTLFQKRLSFNGHPINTDSFETDMYGSPIYIHKYSLGINRLKRDSVSKIPVSADVHVVLNDTDITNGISCRLVKLLYERKYTAIYVIKGKEGYPTGVADFQTSTGFDYPMPSLQTLKKERMDTYFGRSGNGSTSFSPKHVSTEFSFLGDKLTNGYSRYTNASGYWTEETVDLEKDTCVYLEIHKFQYRNKFGNWERPSELVTLLNILHSTGIVMPAKIYGFKKSSVIDAKKNPNMVSFWTWIETAITDYVKNNPTLVQEYVNRDYINNKLRYMQEDLPELGNIVLTWNSLPPTSGLAMFFQKIQEMSKFDNRKLMSVGSVLSRFSTHRIVGTPAYDVVNDYNQLKERYPLLFQAAKEISLSTIASKTWKKPLEEYVTMIDMVTPENAPAQATIDLVDGVLPNP